MLLFNQVGSAGADHPYDPKKLQVAPGVYDFTKAHNYDEDLVRYNLNYVNRPNTVEVLAPSLVKEIPIIPKPNFIKQNMENLNCISDLNLNRQQMLKSQQEDILSREQAG